MADIVKTYLDELDRDYRTGNATEHSHRPALKRLLESILDGLQALNEPKRIACGAPDYIVTRNDIPVGYIEAKDIGMDLNGKAHKAQFDRYKQSLDNIIFTDYIDFHHYINGIFVDNVRIAEIKSGKITPIKANFAKFEQIIKTFGTTRPQGITSPAEIAAMMAGKARLMAEIIEKAIETGGDPNNDALLDQMNAIKEVLIHDITPREFADVYAQTVAYGLFAARLHFDKLNAPHDTSPDTFCRQKAASLIPKTNPFLRNLFDNIAGINLDDRICWIVDALADTFRAANMAEIKQNFGEHTPQNDPTIHFYEDFLSAYNPALRKSRGVWYTPQPVVNFIVRAVDDILQKDFNLPTGLADTSKTEVKRNHPDGYATTPPMEGNKTRAAVTLDVHRVQILDPATGTGTFLAETIRQIHEKFAGQGGMWQKYVQEHLIPRLNGFELLMASYTIAHIKLEQLLSQTGYEATDNQRLRVYLTNSLEEEHETKTFFGSFLIREASEANGIKRDTPIMVVMGNPPYSGESQNKSKNPDDLITNLMAQYKKEPQNPSQNIPDTKWLNNDYVKFIRFGQHFIEKNEEGILAYITDNSFLDSLSFRGMRYNLMKTFDTIYILNLHGNSLKGEKKPTGGHDENVFDIKQGVSINIFVKTKAASAAAVFYCDLYGDRQEKYAFLLENNLKTVNWDALNPQTPHFFFVPKDFSLREEYEKGFKLDEIFPLNGVGICSKRDETAFQNSKNDIIRVLNDFKNMPEHEIKQAYKTETTESRDKKTTYAKQNVATFGIDENSLQQILYRPFEKKWTYFTDKSKGFLAYPVYDVMKHFTKGDNFGLIFKRGLTEDVPPIFVSNCIIEHRCWSRPGVQSGDYISPLYLYPDHPMPGETRAPNLNDAVIAELSKRIGLRFTAEKEDSKEDSSEKFAPIDVLDYIYAVLHSPTYREKYKEFLKIDFPRVPYPASAARFWELAAFGGQLRRLHLLDGVEPQKGTADYPVPGNDEVEKVQYDEDSGKVFINGKQYFENVPREAWEFYIGGYQPAQKWLKDRKGRALSYDDTLHYRRIIRVLAETAALMEAIDS